jgi:hypothetical protein
MGGWAVSATLRPLNLYITYASVYFINGDLSLLITVLINCYIFTECSENHYV